VLNSGIAENEPQPMPWMGPDHFPTMLEAMQIPWDCFQPGFRLQIDAALTVPTALWEQNPPCPMRVVMQKGSVAALSV